MELRVLGRRVARFTGPPDVAFHQLFYSRELPVKCKKNDMVRRVRVRAVVAYPAVSTALVVSFALALASFGPSQAFALTVPPSPTARTTPRPTAISSASVSTPGVPVDHHVLARVEGPGVATRYLAVDAPITDASQFQSIRVRFKLHNADIVPITAAPQLEYRPVGSTLYTVVPEALLRGIPFRVDREWVPSLTPGGGTKQGPLGEDIAVAKLLTGSQGGSLAMVGHHSMGANPDQAVTLPSDSYTEQEFTVLVTADAKYLSTYEFRITNGRNLLAGTQVATVRLGAPPALKLSPGQHKGVAVPAPKPARGNGVAK